MACSISNKNHKVVAFLESEHARFDLQGGRSQLRVKSTFIVANLGYLGYSTHEVQ